MVDLQGLGTLLGGAAAIYAAIRSHQGARIGKATKKTIDNTVVPAVTNHEHMLASLAETTTMMSKLVPVFIEDYTRRMEERRGP